MRMIRRNDTRSYYQRFKDFIFGEKLTEEEEIKREKLMMIAHCYMLGAGGGASGKIEVIRINEKGEEEKVDIDTYYEEKVRKRRREEKKKKKSINIKGCDCSN